MRNLSKTCNCCGTTWTTISNMKPWIDTIAEPTVIGWFFQCKGINSNNEICESTLFIRAEKEENFKMKILLSLVIIFFLLTAQKIGEL